MAGILSDASEFNCRPYGIEDAVQASLDGLKINDQTPYSRLCLLNNLGKQLFIRFRRNGRQPDLELAIQYFTQAVEIASPRSRNRSIVMVNLSNVYHAQYSSHSLGDDLRKALDLVETAHRDCPASFSHTSWLSASNIYIKYFLLSGVRSYLDTALDRFKNALDAFPEEDNFTNKYLVFFAGGHIFWEFYKIKKSQEDMDFAIACYLACWKLWQQRP
jgi:tetratricopeptide (TPR) repeat protein